jgi:hypothetical protein
MLRPMIQPAVSQSRAVLGLLVALAACFWPQRSFAQPTDEPTTLPDNDAPPVHAEDYDPTTLPDDNPKAAGDSDYEPSPIRFEGEFVGLFAFPFDGSSPALGFAATYGVGWGAIPIMLGLDFMTGNRLGTGTSQANIVVNDQMQVVTNTSKLRTYYFDVWLRVQPPRWRVRPYAEGFLGTKFVQTQYTQTFSDAASAEPVVGSDSAWSNSIGWGVGVDFLDLVSADANLSLTLGVRRLSGADVSIEVPAFVDGADIVTKHSLRTSVTIVMLGISGRVDLSAPHN